MNKAGKVLIFVAVSGIISAIPLFPVKDGFVPMGFAYLNLYWLSLDWNIESWFETYFVHSIAIIIVHISLSLAITLAILKRLDKHTGQSRASVKHNQDAGVE